MKIAAIIFDLDGTITEPYLDFDLIRAQIGGIKGPILEEMSKMTPQRRGQAQVILERHELEAAQNSQLNPGVKELLNSLQTQKMPTGLVTRNSRDSVERVLNIHKLHFDCVVTREDGPAKPDPFAVLWACQMLGVRPDESIVVGDYVFDLISAQRAGAVSVLLNMSNDKPSFADQADHIIGNLCELTGLMAQLENHNHLP